MPRTTKVQASHSYGVIDPHAIERRDTKFLQASLSNAANILTLPQGGYTDRGGTRDYGRARRILSSAYSSTPAAAEDISSWPHSISIDAGAAVAATAIDVSGYSIDTGEATLTLQWYNGTAWQDYGSAPIDDTQRTRRFARAPGAAIVTAQLWRVTVSDPGGTATITPGTVTLWAETSTLALALVMMFSFALDTEYQLVLTAGNIDIFKAGAWQAAAALPIAEAQLRLVKAEPKYDTLLLTEQSLAPHALQRQGSDTQWQCAPIVFENLPRYDFGDTDYVNGVDEVQDFRFPSITGGDIIEIYLEGERTIDVTISADPDDSAADIQAALVDLSTVDDGLTVAHQGGGVYRVTFAGGTNAARPWGLLELLNATNGTSAIVNRVTKGRPAGEDVISASRGWPACAKFLQERLILMGMPQIPNGFLASVTGDPYNFDAERAGATRSFFYEIDIGTETTLRIRDAVVTRTLVLFADTAIAYLGAATLSADETPDFRGSDAPGIRREVRPVKTDNRVLYAQVGGQTVNIMNYTELEQNYNSENASVLSAFLIDRPVSMTLRAPASSIDSDVVFMVMETGALVSYTVMRSQEVSGFAPHTTPHGLFRSAACGSARELWLIVERDNDGTTEMRLEKLEQEDLLDAAIVQEHSPASSTIDNLDRFEGKTIWCIGDRQVYGPFTVEDGEIELPETVASSRCGFWPTPFASDHAKYAEEETGRPMPQKKRCFAAEISVLDTTSLAVKVNDGITEDVPLLTFDESDFDVASLDNKITGRIRIEGMPGWTREAIFTVTQAFPGKLTVRSLQQDIVY